MKIRGKFFFTMVTLIFTCVAHSEDSISFLMSKEKTKAQSVYAKYCVHCHAAEMVMVPSPKFQNWSDWEPRAKKALKGLRDSAWKGLEIMPPKGNCNECSKKDLEIVIRYMTSGKIK